MFSKTQPLILYTLEIPDSRTYSNNNCIELNYSRRSMSSLDIIAPLWRWSCSRKVIVERLIMSETVFFLINNFIAFKLNEYLP